MSRNGPHDDAPSTAHNTEMADVSISSDSSAEITGDEEEFFDANDDMINSAANTLDSRRSLNLSSSANASSNVPTTTTTTTAQPLQQPPNTESAPTPSDTSHVTQQQQQQQQQFQQQLQTKLQQHHTDETKNSTKPSTSLSAACTVPASVQSGMVESGIFSMHSSQIQETQCAQTPTNSGKKTTTAPAIIERQTSCDTQSSSDKTIQTTSGQPDSGDSAPKPPPRQRKKKLKDETVAANSSSADSRSMTNSVESTNTSVGKSIHGIPLNPNLTSVLDDIASIKGDLSITEVNDDKRSVYIDDHHLLNRQTNLKQSLLKQELIFNNEQLAKRQRPEVSNSTSLPPQQSSTAAIAQTSTSSLTGSGLEPQKGFQSFSPTSSTSNPEALNSSAGNNTEYSVGDNDKMLEKTGSLPPNCVTDPLSLHLYNLANAYESKKTDSLERSDGSLSNKQDTSLKTKIQNTFNEIKSDLKTSLKSNTDSLKDKHNKKADNECKEEDEYEEDEENKLEPGKIRSGIQNIKKFGTGIMKSVRGIRRGNSTLTDNHRSTFHVDPRFYNGEPDPPPPPARFKLKLNHKGSGDFEGLKIIQEMNDCTGAIWCMKWSNCSRLLAAAGQDHMLRVYCAQQAWKYFTQLRTKASGQQTHISPNSTKERGSSNAGDSYDRRNNKRQSFSRSGSLNTTDSHNNSSSSSSSSAFAMFRDEDTTLSEEGPMLLFTIYRGHTADVLDLAWSKNHFLLSASMDKTVRLWHITRMECLCTFRHIDFVTTIQFHPRDDRYFLSGSLDGKLRLWNIPDKRVTLWNEVTALPARNAAGNATGSGSGSTEPDMNPTHGLITASSFVQNGKFAVVGTYDGRIIFYTTDQLKYFTQIHVTNKSHSTSQATTKVTGLESIDENNKILVTTNDSRLRLYDLRDLSLTCKFKGCINQSSQIKASVSHDHKYIICGSENNSFYIWRTISETSMGQRRDRNKHYECIRLLNPPPQPAIAPPPPPPPPPATTTATASSAATVSGTLASPTTSNAPDTGPGSSASGRDSATIPSTALPSPDSGPKDDSGKKPETTDSTTGNQQSAAAAAQQHSSAATKIVTSANFAPVPGIIDEKAKYVIAIVDFNGYIRLFSKH